MSKRRRKAGLLVLALATVGWLAVASPASAVPVPNACKNSVTANNSQLGSDLSGTSPASATAGGPVQLSGLHQQIAIPGGIFVAGYNLGVLSAGENTIPINLRTVIDGANTTQGSQSTNTVGGSPPNGSVTVTTTITDPDATPGTGDESATDATGSASYADQSWTAGPSGPIEFREDTVTPLAANVGGLIVNALVGGVIPVQFRCSPGTVTGPDPGVVAFTDPAATFASTQVQPASANPPPPTPTTNPQCKKLKKQLKKAKKAHNKKKVKKIRKKLRKRGC